MATRQGWFSHDLRNYGSMILLFIQVVDLSCFVKKDVYLTFGIVDRWSYHLFNSLICGDSPRGISFWMLELSRNDPIIYPSRWLVDTRQSKFPLGFCKYGSMILSSIQVVDLWWFAKGDFSLTFRIMDWYFCHSMKWLYHPSSCWLVWFVKGYFPLLS